MDLRDKLAIDEQQALQFFFEHLRDVMEYPDRRPNEILYNASILAHYAMTSTASPDFPSAPATLDTVFDIFVLDRSQHTDPEIMEAAGSLCLMLTGFFGNQLKHRHNVEWYAKLGASFYDRAALHSVDHRRRTMMAVMALQFQYWREQHARLARELANQAILARYPLLGGGNA